MEKGGRVLDGDPEAVDFAQTTTRSTNRLGYIDYASTDKARAAGRPVRPAAFILPSYIYIISYISFVCARTKNALTTSRQ